MPSIEFYVERPLPCACLALVTTPFPCCPECGGDGVVYTEITLEVEYAYSRASRGARDRYGAPLEPDEDESVELQSATDERGRSVELDRVEQDRAEMACLADVMDRAFDYADD